MSTQSHQVKIKEKIGYAVGDTASNLFFQTFMLFLLYFYTDIFGISAAAAGTMFLITRIWDSVNDPIMGIIADRTKTRWGKFRPYILWLAVPFGLIGVLTFTTPDFGILGKIVYAYITYTLMMMIYTAINVPYSALLGVISPSAKVRTSLSSYRFIFAFVGAFIVQGLTIPLVEYFGKNDQSIVTTSIQDSKLTIQEQGTGSAKILIKASDGKKETESSFLVKINPKGLNPPFVAKEINKIEKNKGFETHKINLNEIFKDIEGQELNFDVVNPDKSVVDADIEDNIVTFHEKGTGIASITLKADDGTEGEATQDVKFIVSEPGNMPPRVENELQDISLISDFKKKEIDISNVFTDLDKDDLNYLATSTRPDVASVLIAGNTLTIKENGKGIADISLKAFDGKGGEVSTQLQVKIKSENENAPVIDDKINNKTLTAGFNTTEVDISGVFKDFDGDTMNYEIITVNESKGFQWTMTLYAILAALLFLFTFGSTKERVSPSKQQKTSLGKDLKDLIKNIPWVVLFFIGIFTLSYVSVRNGAIMYYFKYYVGNEVLASAFMVAGTIATIAGIFVVERLSKKMGKKLIYIWLMGLATVFTALFYFLKSEQIILMFVLQVLVSFIIGPTSPIVWAMYADTADYSEYKTGRRATGLVFSASTMAQKFGWTIGGAIAGWMLAYFGFKANVIQSAETRNGIRLMMSFIPAIGSVLAGGLMIFYKLDEATMQNIEGVLESRREKEDEGNTSQNE